MQSGGTSFATTAPAATTDRAVATVLRTWAGGVSARRPSDCSVSGAVPPFDRPGHCRGPCAAFSCLTTFVVTMTLPPQGSGGRRGRRRRAHGNHRAHELGRALETSAPCSRGCAGSSHRHSARTSALLRCTGGRCVRRGLAAPGDSGGYDPARRPSFRDGRFPHDPGGDQPAAQGLRRPRVDRLPSSCWDTVTASQ